MSVSSSDKAPQVFAIDTGETTNSRRPTTNSAISSSAAPSLNARPIGWHAQQLNYNWNVRGDQHKYLLANGLPEVHAAIINEDWDYASQIVCPDDLALVWKPPVSQRPPTRQSPDSHESSWANPIVYLPEKMQRAGTAPEQASKPKLDDWLTIDGADAVKKNEKALAESIRDQKIKVELKPSIVLMASHLHFATCVAGTNLYGVNLLTLCLLKPAPEAFTRKVIEMAAKHAPQCLDNPDAAGRTPLYIALERNDMQLVGWLVSAGATGSVRCDFPGNDEGVSALSLALKQGKEDLFLLLMERAAKLYGPTNEYPTDRDPLGLRKWASKKNEKKIRELAGKFKNLEHALRRYPDRYGDTVLAADIGLTKDKNRINFFGFSKVYEKLKTAAMTADTKAFENAVPEFQDWHDDIKNLIAGKTVVDWALFSWAIRAGSLRSVDTFLTCGLRLKDQRALIDEMFQKRGDHFADQQTRHHDSWNYLIAHLADLDPAGLAKRLKGQNVWISATMVALAKTNAGREALIALTKSGSKPQAPSQ